MVKSITGLYNAKRQRTKREHAPREEVTNTGWINAIKSVLRKTMKIKLTLRIILKTDSKKKQDIQPNHILLVHFDSYIAVFLPV